MARGRMINSIICTDKRINDLCDDTSRLAFTWLVTFADAEGRTHGDPALLCSLLFPRRRDVTPETMEAYVKEWAALGLIIWYKAKDDLWIYFPGFERNQVGLRKDREPQSDIPAPQDGEDVCGLVPDDCRITAGNDPANVPPNRTEQNRTEQKGRRARAAADAPPTPEAVKIFRTEARRYPPKTFYAEMDTTIGVDQDALEKWRVLVRGWVGHGWNPSNVVGMLEAFRNGGIEHGANATRANPALARQPPPEQLYNPLDPANIHK